MNNKTIISSSILFIFIIVIYYLSGLIGSLEFILSISVYTIIFFGLNIAWSKIRKKEPMSSHLFVEYFLYRVSTLLLGFTILIGGLSYLSNEIYPAPMPEYTISNGTKVITFQTMSHIGTQEFYTKVQSNIKEYKEKGGVYFFEGVKPGSKENLNKFNDAIGIEFDEHLYKNFSKLYGVVNQDNRIFLGLVNNLDFNIDIGINEIIQLYEDKLNKKNDSKKIKHSVPVDANKIIIETLSQLNERELKILVYINQAILNFIISNESTRQFLTNNFSNKDLFEVILGERNKVIAKSINESGYNNIYMTYGLLHFKGVLELLKETDPEWKIISTKNLYPIKN